MWHSVQSGFEGVEVQPYIRLLSIDFMAYVSIVNIIINKSKNLMVVV